MNTVWSEKAIADLKDIYDYYHQHSPQGALNVVSDIIQTVSQLSFPYQYQVYEYQPKYRRIVVRDFLILYQVKKENVFIDAIISGKQNPVPLT